MIIANQIDSIYLAPAFPEVTMTCCRNTYRNSIINVMIIGNHIIVLILTLIL